MPASFKLATLANFYPPFPLSSRPFAHIHTTFNKTDLIHESGAGSKEVRVSDNVRAREEHSTAEFQREAASPRDLAAMLQVVLSIRVSEAIKIRRRLQKFLSVLRHGRSAAEVVAAHRVRGTAASSSASRPRPDQRPDGSEGHIPKVGVTQNGRPRAKRTVASDVLYDHVDPGTLVIAIEAIYLDPRAK